VPPTHIDVGDAVILIVGVEFTVTVTVAVLLHPTPLDPVTVYVVLLVGATVILAVLPPVLQLYVLAPLAVNTEVPPTHIDVGDAVTLIVGVEFTVTVTVAVLLHPTPLDPVTVYVVLLVGATVILAVLPPVLQLYVLPPLAVNTEVPPTHIDDGDAVILIVGVEFTVTVTVAVLLHPTPLDPVTVYVVLLVGATVILAVLPPVLQLYVFAPLAVITEVCPLHIAAGLAVAVTDGNGFTVTLTVAVPVHPAVLVPVTVYVVVALGVTVLLAPLPNPPDQL